MQFHILASGSKGNSLYINTGAVKILVDCGISLAKLKNKLDKFNVELGDIDALFISHGHSDHIKSLSAVSKHVSVYMTKLLYDSVKEKFKLDETHIFLFSNNEKLILKDISVTIFPVMHDCIDPVGFIFENKKEKLGVVTDIGCVTKDIVAILKKCSFLLIEANHDIGLLSNAERPWFLKDRIFRKKGHLSNRSAGKLISDIYHSKLKEVILMHLSEDCNNPELAINTVKDELQKKNIKLSDIKAATPNGELISL
jgi:phosphoribosyl 1,2-cyclic phosphodiesterase